MVIIAPEIIYLISILSFRPRMEYGINCSRNPGGYWMPRLRTCRGRLIKPGMTEVSLFCCQVIRYLILIGGKKQETND